MTAVCSAKTNNNLSLEGTTLNPWYQLTNASEEKARLGRVTKLANARKLAKDVTLTH